MHMNRIQAVTVGVVMGHPESKLLTDGTAP